MSRLDDMTPEERAATEGWMRSRPEAIQRSMRVWPPGAIVQAREAERLLIPRPGALGCVNSYFENGDLGIIHLDQANDPVPGDVPMSGACKPEWLELVEYGPLTAAEVDRLLG